MNIRQFPKSSSSLAEKLSIPSLDSLFSDGSLDFVTPGPPHRIGDEITIRLRGRIGVEVKSVHLRIFPDGEERLVKMTSRNRKPFTYWSANVLLTRTPFQYRFRIQTSRNVFWLNACGLHLFMPPDDEDFRLIADFEEPAWVKKSVFYQIFPDRFRCSKPEISMAPRKISPCLGKVVFKKWGEPVSRPNLGEDFYGGDLWGILEMSDHLQRLGINAVYLNPIFEAASNHRYDTINYRVVDPFLGGNEALIALSDRFNKLGIRIVLDGVFNHCGYHHPWFQEALKNKNSEYREMFSFSGKGDEYVSWLGHSSLPKWNYSSQKVRDEIFSGKDAIAKFWLRPPFNIDGWRLDAPNMLGCNGVDDMNIEIWREFRKEVKKEKSDSYIFGECFFEGTKWLQGDAFDAAMNYKGFSLPLLQWISGYDLHLNPGELPGTAAVQWMKLIMARIPFQIRNLQYNCLSTHDIPRFIHRVSGNIKLYKLGLAIQMAFPGVPSIYYGEEICLDGGEDPDNRRPMDWNAVEKNSDLIAFIAHLTNLRKKMSVLHSGAFVFLYADDEALSFARFLGEDFLIVAANRSEYSRRVKIPLGVLGIPNGFSLKSLLTMDSLKTVYADVLDLVLSPREVLWLVPAQNEI